MTILLGAAQLLQEARDFAGQVCLIFQPSEERGSGALQMIRDGLFDRFPIEQIFGLHNWPGLAAGQLVVHDGPMMAGTSEFELTFTAAGGHVGKPHLSGDPLLAGGHFLVGLQQAVSRAIDPQEAAVAFVGSFHGGHAENIIPQSSVLRGTVRAFRSETLEVLRQRIRAIAGAAASMAGCAHALVFEDPICPPCVNTRGEAQLMRRAAALAGLEFGPEDLAPSMAGDDFGWFLHHRPGAYAWIGNGCATAEGGLHQTGSVGYRDIESFGCPLRP